MNIAPYFVFSATMFFFGGGADNNNNNVEFKIPGAFSIHITNYNFRHKSINYYLLKSHN